MKGMKEVENLKIILVDDDQDLLFMYSEHIKDCGLNVDTYSDPIEALDAIKKNPSKYKILITDYQMGEVSGLDLLSQLRDQKYYGLDYLAVFSSLIDSEEFQDKFNDRFKSDKNKISLLNKDATKGPEEIERFFSMILSNISSNREIV